MYRRRKRASEEFLDTGAKKVMTHQGGYVARVSPCFKVRITFVDTFSSPLPPAWRTPAHSPATHQRLHSPDPTQNPATTPANLPPCPLQTLMQQQPGVSQLSPMAHTHSGQTQAHQPANLTVLTNRQPPDGGEPVPARSGRQPSQIRTVRVKGHLPELHTLANHMSLVFPPPKTSAVHQPRQCTSTQRRVTDPLPIKPFEHIREHW